MQLMERASLMARLEFGHLLNMFNQRDLPNLKKGTNETKPVSVKKENYLQMILENVLPGSNPSRMAVNIGALIDYSYSSPYLSHAPHPTQQRPSAF
jgi:hypothetical protein